MASQSPLHARSAAWRFSLRSLLAATVVVAICFATWTDRARRQQSAVERLRQLNIRVAYDYEGTRWHPTRGEPFIGSRLLGVDYFHNATWVMLLDVETAEPAIPLLKQLPNLNHIQLSVDHLDDTDRATKMLRSELPGVAIEVEGKP